MGTRLAPAPPFQHSPQTAANVWEYNTAVSTEKNMETHYLDTLHRFLEAEKHFFVCPKAKTPHIPGNPPHSWPVAATCRCSDSDGPTSSLRCIEAPKQCGRNVKKIFCSNQKLVDFAACRAVPGSSSLQTKLHTLRMREYFPYLELYSFLALVVTKGGACWVWSREIGQEWPHYHKIFSRENEPMEKLETELPGFRRRPNVITLILK